MIWGPQITRSGQMVGCSLHSLLCALTAIDQWEDRGPRPSARSPATSSHPQAPSPATAAACALLIGQPVQHAFSRRRARAPKRAGLSLGAPWAGILRPTTPPHWSVGLLLLPPSHPPPTSPPVFRCSITYCHHALPSPLSPLPSAPSDKHLAVLASPPPSLSTEPAGRTTD